MKSCCSVIKILWKLYFIIKGNAITTNTIQYNKKNYSYWKYVVL